MAKSTKSRQSDKPLKPYKGFPLFPHATNRWAKKIRGKFYYFGKVSDDPEGTAALEEYNRQYPYLKDGRTPPPIDIGDAFTIKDLVNRFLTAKRGKLLAGELTARSFEDYYQTCELVFDHFGRHRRVDDLRSDDFAQLRTAMAKRWGAVRLRNMITRVRMLFKFAYDERLVQQPVHYGQSFAPPSAKTLRKARHEAGPRLFTADELREILDACDPVLRAMTLLGVNCGFGNTDIAALPVKAIDFGSGFVEFPRPKTAIQRRIPLWPETLAALKAAIEKRPKAKSADDAGLCFLTIRGTRWIRVTEREKDKDERQDFERYVRHDQLSMRFGKLLRSLKINGRKGLGFYTLRHNFETVAGESRDQVAVNAIMGHVDNTMAGQYRESISDDRLRDAVNVVRKWLWPERREK